METAFVVLLLVMAIGGVACLFWANLAGWFIVDEVNVRSELNERIEGPFFGPGTQSRVLRRRPELYPESPVRRRMNQVVTIGFELIIGAFFGVLVLSNSNDRGKTISLGNR